VLIDGVDAMLGKVCGVRIVNEIIQRSDDWVAEDIGEMELARGIERSVDADSNKGCEESECREED
jgi:hypothetical protein